VHHFKKSWAFFCLHRSFSILSQSHQFRSRCPTLPRSRSCSLGIFKGWSQSRSPKFLNPGVRHPQKNKDSASRGAILQHFCCINAIVWRLILLCLMVVAVTAVVLSSLADGQASSFLVSRDRDGTVRWSGFTRPLLRVLCIVSWLSAPRFMP